MIALPFGSQISKPSLSRFRDGAGVPQGGIRPVTNFLHHQSNAILERDPWLPVQASRGLRDVSERAVGLARTLRDMDDGAADQFDQAIDRSRLARADVVTFAHLLRL